jgi:hypothetical protein
LHVPDSMPHSILKKTPLPTAGPSRPPARSREDRNRETALYHAELLQQRKEVEAQILASLETLIDLPSSPTADAARPSNADSVLVKNSLRLFQPSDYDSLIEERNIGRQCGYVLCQKHNRQENTKAKYRILQKAGKGRDALKVVETKTLERWCSDDCGKRALYIKVQLNEEPAWTRTNASSGDIVLLMDKSENGEAGLIERLRGLDLSQEDTEIGAQMKALAIERGDGIAPNRSIRLADIRETTSMDNKATPPEIGTKNGEASDSIEGHTPRFSGKKLRAKDDDDNDDIIGTI